MSITISSLAKDETQADRPLQRLAGAILIQALQDASNGPRRYREEALDWILGRSKSGFTFEFCCSLLGRDPNDVRERLKRQNVIPKWDPTEDQPTTFPSMSSFRSGFQPAGDSFHARAS